MLQTNSTPLTSRTVRSGRHLSKHAHRDRISARSAFIRLKKVTQQYGIQLRKIARHVDDIVRGFDATTAEGQRLIQAHLRRYSHTLDSWAESAADLMIGRVAAADSERWRRQSQEIGRGLEREIQSANIAPAMAEMKADQVRLIKSIPSEAADRVYRVALDGVTKGLRTEVIAEQIYQTGAVSRSRSTLIARTEVGRAATTLQAARASSAGSTHFRWLSAGDKAVRPSHRALNGKIFAWSDPPVCDAPDIRALPGAVFNCRCLAVPLFND